MSSKEDRLSLIDRTTGHAIEIPETVEEPVVDQKKGGWAAYAYWCNTGQPISLFRTTWEVPPPPATPGTQIIYLFNSLNPQVADLAILQPVLQWGSHGGGGPYWSAASWFVNKQEEAFHTPLVRVNTGDVLVGVIRLMASYPEGFHDYQVEFEGMSNTTLRADWQPPLVGCSQALEAYGVTKCSDLPAAKFTAMRSIRIETGAVAPTITWTVGKYPVGFECGQHAVVKSYSATDGEVDLYYGKAE